RRAGLFFIAHNSFSLNRKRLPIIQDVRGVSLLKICDQTRHKSIEMLRVYCRDAELFVGNAAAGLLWGTTIIGIYRSSRIISQGKRRASGGRATRFVRVNSSRG